MTDSIPALVAPGEVFIRADGTGFIPIARRDQTTAGHDAAIRDAERWAAALRGDLIADPHNPRSTMTNDRPANPKAAAIAGTVLAVGFALMLVLFGIAAIIWAL